MMFWLFLLMAQAVAPTQIERGEALYMDANGCASCHQLKGKGTAAGPDLKLISSLAPKAIAMAIRSTVTQYVVVAKPKAGGSFPAYISKVDDKTDMVWDLSAVPPTSQKLARADYTTETNATWKHPPVARKYTDAQMADIVAYVRYAGSNSRAAVDPDDIK